MADYANIACLKSFRTGFYSQDPGMMPYQFKKHYTQIPVYMTGGVKKTFSIEKYISKFKGDRTDEPGSLRSQILNHYGDDLDPSVRSWLFSKRLVACFAGHGLPEELSLLASYAVYSGYKSAGQVMTWAPDMFGLDCNGFASAYFTAITAFKKPLYYIPSFTKHAGLAKKASEPTYDGVICFARIVGSDGKNDKYSRSKKWQVRPNLGNGSHIMVVDCWADKGSSLWVTQMSATYGLDTHIYNIQEAPDTGMNQHAIWRIQRDGKNKYSGINVMISHRMPEWLGKKGEEE